MEESQTPLRKVLRCLRDFPGSSQEEICNRTGISVYIFRKLLSDELNLKTVTKIPKGGGKPAVKYFLPNTFSTALSESPK